MTFLARRNLAYNAADGIEIWLVDPLQDEAKTGHVPGVNGMREGFWVVLDLSKRTLDDQVNCFDLAGQPLEMPRALRPEIHVQVTQSETLPLDQYVFKAAYLWHDSQGDNGSSETGGGFNISHFFRRN